MVKAVPWAAASRRWTTKPTALPAGFLDGLAVAGPLDAPRRSIREAAGFGPLISTLKNDSARA
jgi:hypothetical protein